ncbi:MAG: hypothetical protein ACJ74Y_05840 [Bryobacteraceae bacterium]
MRLSLREERSEFIWRPISQRAVSAFASQAEDGLEISYRDTEGRDIEKERFPGITDID